MSDKEIKEIVRIIKLCARIVLENGGETYRAEETVNRICTAFGFDETDVFAIPTGIFIAVSKDGVSTSTTITRITKRVVNLTAIEKANDISRRIVEGTVTTAEALAGLKEVYCRKPSRKAVPVVIAGLSSGFFALLFRGSIFDFIAAAIGGMLAQFAASFIKTDLANFAGNILGGLLIGISSILFVKLTGTGELEKIITGAITPLLPGVPMVNAIRDTMRGDLLSGVSRGAEALLIAIELAFGVGIVLKFYFQFVK